MPDPLVPPAAAPSDFIRDIVAADVAAQRCGKIVTRFPPEPNGYLHIGHAKSICLNFGIARENNGVCNLRFDDTNPAKEDLEYVESITADVRWLIEGWADHCLGFKPRGATAARQTVSGQPDYYLGAVDAPTLGQLLAAKPGAAEPFSASDYFDQLHDYAVELIKRGKAYVCDLSPEDTDKYRGAPDQPGRDSPWRNRTVAESLDLFARMKAGEFPNGARSLRARIDMGAPNVWLRDPLLYRIRHASHHHTGDKWCIYPLYDYAHCLSDYLEGITHSICTLEFVDHRPLYDWILESLGLPRALPHQYEFAKLNLGYTIVSKRKLHQLVLAGHVTGWDDPRMPTLSGLRRRGVPASAIRRFAADIGVTKYDSVTDAAVFEHALRTELNSVALRRLAVLRPLKIVLTNLREGEVIECQATNNPQDDTPTSRPVALTREVFIEVDDFAEVPPPKYFRLKPGGDVRLKYACIIKCDEIVRDADGAIRELRCTADLDTRSGGANADKKVKGTIHWVSASNCVTAEVRLYDRLFNVAEPDADGKFLEHVNPASLEVVAAKVEASLGAAVAGERFQFERLGYFAVEAKDAESKDVPSPGAAARIANLESQIPSPGAKLVFNRTITLRDAWAK